MTGVIDQEAIAALHALGRTAWPDIELDVATFSAYAGSRMHHAAIDDIRADELYLAIACAAQVEAAIAAFDERYLCRLGPMLIRRGYDPATAADAVQAVRLRFLVGEPGHAPRISEYDGRGSLAMWIRIAAVRIAISARRKHGRETADDVDLVSAEQGPELELLCRRFGGAFDAAFRSTFKALSPRERMLLRYQVIDRLGIDRIATLYGVHRATAARWVAQARDALAEGVRQRLQAQFRIDADELDSLLRLVHSKLELSLGLLLTPSLDKPGPRTAATSSAAGASGRMRSR